MAKRPDTKQSKRMNALLREARGFTVESVEDDDDEAAKKRKAQHDEMNARLRAARGFTVEEIEGS